MRRFVLPLLALSVVTPALARAQGSGSALASDDPNVTVNLDAINAPAAAPIPEIPPEPVPVKRVPLPRRKPVFDTQPSVQLTASDMTAPVAPPPVAPAPVPAASPAVRPPRADLPVTIVDNFPVELRGVAQDPLNGSTPRNPTAGFSVIGRIRFAPGSSAVPATATAPLDSVAAALAQTTQRIRIAAYSGAPGDMSSPSRRLSLERARAVRDYLVTRGVPFERMDLLPFGGTRDGITDRVDVLAPSA